MAAATMSPEMKTIEPVPAGDPQTAESLTLVVFAIAGQDYAISIACVREILAMAELSHPPYLPKFVEGLLNLAGDAVPIIRMDKLFGSKAIAAQAARAESPERRAGLYTPMLIVEIDGQTLGILADSVRDTIKIAADDVLPLGTKHSFNACASGIVRRGAGTALLLDPRRILLEEESEYLSEIRSMESARLDALSQARRGESEVEGISRSDGSDRRATVVPS